MALKLNVGVSRKIGLPAFGSVGASCSLELELPHDLLERDLEGFHGRVRGAYVAARHAVQDELARLHAGAQAGPPDYPEPGDGCAGAPQRPPAGDAGRGRDAGADWPLE